MNKRQKKKLRKKLELSLWDAIYKVDLEKKMIDLFVPDYEEYKKKAK